MALTVASLAAARWDTWPGDFSGLRLFRGTLLEYIRPAATLSNAIGEQPRLVLLTAAVAAWLAFRGHRRTAVLLMVMMLVEISAVVLLTSTVHRPRPQLPLELQALAEVTGNSFPSGHVTFSVAFFGAVAYLLIRYWRRRGWPRQLVLALVLLPVVLTGPARVAWGVHWPSDALGGYLLGFMGVQLFMWLDQHSGKVKNPSGAPPPGL